VISLLGPSPAAFGEDVMLQRGDLRDGVGFQSLNVGCRDLGFAPSSTTGSMTLNTYLVGLGIPAMGTLGEHAEICFAVGARDHLVVVCGWWGSCWY
jgi:hypothetical protein